MSSQSLVSERKYNFLVISIAVPQRFRGQEICSTPVPWRLSALSSWRARLASSRGEWGSFGRMGGRGRPPRALPRPGRPHPFREFPVLLPPGVHEHLAPPVEGKLDHDVGGRAESVDRQFSPPGQVGPPQGAEPDDAGAPQRGGFGVADGGRQGIGERLRHDRVLGEPAVAVIPRKQRPGAQVLLSPTPTFAYPAGSRA